LLTLALPAIASAQDPLEIIRRATELDRRDTALARSYTFLQRQERRDLDSKGRLTKTESDTFDVTLLVGVPYRRLVAHNDRPLSPKDQSKEEEKLQKSIEDRRKESPAQHAQRVADWERKQDKQREPLKELPNAFNFKLVGEEALNGGVAFVIEGTPKPGYRPKSQATSFFPKVKLRLCVDKKDYQWIKVDIESLDTISFGGFLFRLAKGSHVTIENARVNNEIWMPKRAAIKGSARIALVKVMRGEMIFTFSDYRKFQTDSRVLTQ
jgi:hypothetical protein